MAARDGRDLRRPRGRARRRSTRSSRPLDEADWNRATPADGLDRARPDRPPRVLRRHRDGRARRRRCVQRVRRGVARRCGRAAIRRSAAARAMTGAELLGSWRAGRAALLAELRRTDPKARIPWYGPAMSAVSFATARLMETWAHGQDIVDALGATRPADRSAAPRRPHRCAGAAVQLRDQRPGGARRRGARRAQRAQRRALESGTSPPPIGSTGDALDFCLVVTQRRHVADTGLVVEGPLAEDWIAIAQAFAGPPGAGPAARPVHLTARVDELERLGVGDADPASVLREPVRACATGRRRARSSSWSPLACIVDSNWLAWHSSAASFASSDDVTSSAWSGSSASQSSSADGRW